jgi:3'(2'), 5'-bisphosphate nucleotidase
MRYQIVNSIWRRPEARDAINANSAGPYGRNATKVRPKAMQTIDVHTMLNSLIAIAADAGATIMRHYEAGVSAQKKADKSPVTIADHEAEALILEALSRAAPGIPIVAEEEAAAGRIPRTGDLFFLVDPLDGTREFLNRNGEFTVNIGLIERGSPILGVVFAPAQDRMFAGALGSGAFEISKEAQRSISARRPPAEGMVAVASRSHRDAQTAEILAAHRIATTVNAGSSLKFCLIAAGEADIYPRAGRTMEWDTAAGHAVLAAAGGRVTLLDGRTMLTYGKTADSFANPHFIAWGKSAD